MTTIGRLAITVATGLAAAAGIPAAATLSQPNGGGFRLDGQAVRRGETTLAGAGFTLSGAVASSAQPRGGGYVLAPARTCAGGSAATGATCGCLCSQTLFADGFESGDVSAWSQSVP